MSGERLNRRSGWWYVAACDKCHRGIYSATPVTEKRCDCGGVIINLLPCRDVKLGGHSVKEQRVSDALSPTVQALMGEMMIERLFNE